MTNDKNTRRKVYSGVKITLNSFISVFIVLIVLLIGIFVVDKFEATPQNSLEYWTSKILMGVSTFLLMLAMSNITEESRKKRDKDFIDRVAALDVQYTELMANNRTVALETFIEQLNRRNKYLAYVEAIKRKLNRTRAKNVKKIAKLEKQLLLTPDEVWNGVKRVKYYKVTFNQLVAGETDVATKDDEYDLLVHKGRYTAKKLGIKAVTIIAFSAVALDFAFHFQGFSKDMILTLVFKLVSMLIAVYSGVSFGYSMMERRRSTVKKKLRIFSQFNERIKLDDVSDDDRFKVEIPRDVFVEKVREKAIKEEQAHNEQAEVLNDFGDEIVPKNSHLMSRFLTVR